MSELKAFNLPRYAGEFTTHEVYLKSEADEVISKLEAENESLLQQNRELCQALHVMYSKEEVNRLLHALWLVRSYAAQTRIKYINADWYEGFEKDLEFWNNVKEYCEHKADKFKEGK